MYLECGAGYKKIVEQDTKRGPTFEKSELPNGSPTPPKHATHVKYFHIYPFNAHFKVPG